MSIPLSSDPHDSRIRFHALLIVGVCSTVYFNTLFNGFVYDDRFQVLENPWITDLRSIPKMFTAGVWEFEGDVSNYYRPVMHLSYALTYLVSGLRPWGYHAVNILLHIAVSLLTFLTVLALLELSGACRSKARLPALFGALLFATHPIVTETVAWVACVPELSFTLFFLLSLLLYVRAESLRSGTFAVSAAAYCAATFCKETAITLPFVLVLYDYALKPERPHLAEAAKRYAPFVLATILYLVVRFSVLSAFAPVRRQASLTMYQDLINAFPLFAKYLGKLLLPTNLNAFHVFSPILTIWSPRGIVSLLLTAAFAAAMVLTFQRSRRVFFALSLIVLPLAPVLYIRVLAENAFTERYLYLPAVGFAFVATFGLAWLQRCRPEWMRVAIVISTLVIGVYSVATIQRNAVWKSGETLWTDTVRKSADSATVRNELGTVFADRGAVNAAIGEYQAALRLDPDFATAYNNLGNIYTKAGRFREAVEAYRAALRLRPGLFATYLNLGNAYSEMGLLDQAMEQYEAAARLKPESAETHLHLGIAHGVRGMLDEAIVHLETAARLSGTDPVIRENLAHAYDLKGLHDKAEEQRRRAAALRR
jgi:tetratricopeptide (TPR) repeat protein